MRRRGASETTQFFRQMMLSEVDEAVPAIASSLAPGLPPAEAVPTRKDGTVEAEAEADDGGRLKGSRLCKEDLDEIRMMRDQARREQAEAHTMAQVQAPARVLW